jgi:HSP20 family molecular chaperone IbpA
MSRWQKKDDNSSIDFETLEMILGEIVENLDTANVDFTKPFKIGFTLILDSEGYVNVKEFGIISASQLSDSKKEQPLVEMIDFGEELVAAVELNGLSKRDINVKILNSKIIVSSKTSKKFSKNIKLPCPVDKSSIKTEFNNNVLEIRIKKQKIEPRAKA